LCAPSTGIKPPGLPSSGEVMPRQEGGHEQLSYRRAQKQADEAVDGGSKGQIELRRKAVEHRLGHLTTTSFILGDILGRNYRAQQIRAAYDPFI
jgi:hypothetical protein